MIAGHCYIIDMDHGFKRNEFIRNQHNIVEPIIIGEDVWIASDVAVLRGSIIKNGAVIGAKALVKGRIPENSIAVGIPAKVIKERK